MDFNDLICQMKAQLMKFNGHLEQLDKKFNEPTLNGILLIIARKNL